MKIVNQTKNTVLATNASIADTPFGRIKGLLGRKNFIAGEALILKPCNCVHTFFMLFTIDILFVDKTNRILKTVSSLAPNAFSPICFGARFTIELPAGTIKASSTQEGDTIVLIK